jgi:hypothetical protein
MSEHNETNESVKPSKAQKAPKVKKVKVAKVSSKSSKLIDQSKISMGFPLGGALTWFTIDFESGKTTENISSQRIFRADPALDYGTAFTKTPKGKLLLRTLRMTLGANPAYFNKDGIFWYCPKDKIKENGDPVFPLAGVLWAGIKKKGRSLQSGILARIKLDIDNNSLWLLIAYSPVGVARITSTRTSGGNAITDLTTTTASGAGLQIGYEVVDVTIDDLKQWFNDKKIQSYPQEGVWAGKPKKTWGKYTMTLGLVSVLVSGAAFFYGSEQLQKSNSALQVAHHAHAEFLAERRAFFDTHAIGVAQYNTIPYNRWISASIVLWKPGTVASLNKSATSGPIIQAPGATEANGSGVARITIFVPPTKNISSGQSYWVSESLLNSVIQENPVYGFSLKSVTPSPGGKGFNVLFESH